MKKTKISSKILTCVLTLCMLSLVFAFPIKTGGTVYSLQGLNSELVAIF